MKRLMLLTTCLLLLAAGFVPMMADDQESGSDPTQLALADIATMDVGEGDWPQWGGWHGKNNTPAGENIPTEWDVQTGENILWSSSLGSQTYGNSVIANGQVYVGTNNHHGYLARYPKTVDLGVLLCFDEKTGEFLWQHSSPKLSTGRVHDWPDQGICCAPYVDGERLWFVTSRGEVRCLDTKGFRDGENDGPYKAEDVEAQDEADVIWVYDMMGENGVSQHNMCSCSVTCVGDILLVNTSNGVDESHINIPAPGAPSFMAMNKNTGEVLWTDKSPGTNILHGQWSSPTYARFGDTEQVLFAGGDGWLYSFVPAGDGAGNAKLLWKFDCNPKETKWELGGAGTRNNIIATPVVYDGMVYVAVGQDPEHGEGLGHLWCIDPLKKTDGSDVSPTLAEDKDGKILPHRRLQAVNVNADEQTVENPDSAEIWHYTGGDTNDNGEIDWEEEMHRSCGTVAIKDDILYISDFSGLFHCLNARTGEPYWTYDLFAQAWGSPLIVDGHVYIGDEDGDVAIFEHSTESNEPIAEVSMNNSVYSTPVVANGVLFISNKSTLFAIKEGAQSDPAE
ncbi:MAG: PQQ-binding-like beta-propeller repeat protein [Planctomycetaceae bacterium]